MGDARLRVAGRDLDDPLGRDLERDLELNLVAGTRLVARELELAEQLVARGAAALTLIDLDEYALLIVAGGREDPGVVDWHRRVAIDHGLAHAAGDAQPQGQRSDVEQVGVGLVRGQRVGVDGRSDRHDLVGIDVHLGFPAEVLLDGLADGRQPSGTAHEDHAVEVPHSETRLLQRLVAHLEGALDQIGRELLELGAAELVRQIDVVALVPGEAGHLDRDLVLLREPDLGRLGGRLELLEGEGVGPDIEAVGLLHVVGEQVNHAIVEVVPAEVGVARRGQHLEHVPADLEHGHVEGAPAEVVDDDLLLEVAAVAIGEGGGGRLVHDAHHVEARDPAGVLGRLALVVVEVGGNRDDRATYLCAETSLGDLLHLPQHEARDLRQREVLFADANAHALVVASDNLVVTDGARLLHLLAEGVAADQALRGADRVLRVEDDAGLGLVADRDAPVLAEGDDGGRGGLAERVREHAGASARHGRDAGIARPEVDADRRTFAHVLPRPCRGTRETHRHGGRRS